jgi:putative redox protein
MAGEPEPQDLGADRPRALELDLTWTRDFQFEARGRGGVVVTIDGDGAAGPSPMESLLAALGSCAATDIVDILRKGRRPPRELSVRLKGERREEVPRRYVRIRAVVRIAGEVDRPRAERAVKLAFEKYCSVRASLDPALPIEVGLRLEP